MRIIFNRLIAPELPSSEGERIDVKTAVRAVVINKSVIAICQSQTLLRWTDPENGEKNRLVKKPVIIMTGVTTQ
ncbi:hypothetical protein TMSI_21670 [Klebsiella quasipneumoniae]|nr:hypothetical protein TMSI_21670 [Klebsiella quasipneumoniae]GKO57911.1 hypothetical protein NUBL21977_03550 [Klebsiella quasipneumoniae]